MKRPPNTTRTPSHALRLLSLIAVVVGLIGWSTGSAHGSGRDILPLSAPDGALGSFSALGTGVDVGSGTRAVWSIATWGTNRIVVGGEFRGMGGVASTSAVAVWNGSSWSALGSGFDPGQVYSVAALDDNTLVAAVKSNNGDALDNVHEWNGSTWVQRASVDSGALGEGDVVPWAGSIAISGRFTAVTASATVPANFIALLSGVTASALGTGLDSNAYSLARWSDTKLAVGGNFTSAGGVAGTNGVAVWNSSTSAWGALGGGTNASVRAIASKDDDSLVVGGLFDHAVNANGTTVSGTARIAMWNSSTSAWSALGSGLGETWPDLVRSIAVDSDRDLIYAGGRFRKHVGGTATSLNGIGVWDEGISEWVPLRYSSSGNGVSAIVNNFVDVLAVAVDGPRVYLGGYFDQAGATPGTARIAKWTWDPPQGSNVVGSLPATLSGEGFIGVPATGGVKFGNAVATYTRENSTTITVTSIAGSEWNGSPISVDGVGGWGTVGTCGPPLCPDRPVYVPVVMPSTTTTPPSTPPAPEPDVVLSLPTMPESTPLAGSTGTTMSPGEPITVTYGGFTPGEIVHLWVNSTPQLIGSGTADSTGSVTITGSMPSGITAGLHSLVLYAPLSGTGVRQVISVAPLTLPVTGTDVSLVPLALALLLAGVISRRLRRNWRASGSTS